MPEQNFLSATQNSFLSALPETTNNQVITGFDSFAPVQFCTPSFLGCKLCIGANVVGGFVTLTVQASTPFGGFSKSFKITNNVTFSWNPIGVLKLEFKIANFKKTGNTFSFTLTVKVCVVVPIFGDKCASYSHTFSIPTALPSIHQSLLTAKADDASLLSNNDYSTLLLLHAMLDKEQACDCEKND